MKRTVLVCACAGILPIQRTNAAMISFSEPFASQPVPGSATIPLPKFDPALGTLLKVTLTVDATANGGSITFDNESAAAPGANVMLTIGATLEALVPVFGAIVAAPSTVGSSMVLPDNDGTPDFAGTDSFTLAGAPSMASNMAMLNSGFEFFVAGMMGETFDVGLSSETLATFSIMNGFGPSQSTAGTAGGLITVTYEYVPMPGSFALATVGFICMAQRRRHPAAE